MLDLADSAAQEGYRTFRTAPDRDAAHVVADLASTTHGLSADEAERRLRQHGPNSIPTGTRRHPVLRFLAHFNNALIYFLLAGAAAAAALGHLIDTGVILAVVLVNAVVGFLQEGKAEDALAAIRNMIAPRASVLRDGQRVSVPQADLVPGDVVLIEAGDRVGDVVHAGSGADRPGIIGVARHGRAAVAGSDGEARRAYNARSKSIRPAGVPTQSKELPWPVASTKSS